MAEIFERVRGRKKIIIYVFLAALIIILGARTVIRNRDWKSNLTIFGHDVQYSKQSFELEGNYAFALIKAERYDEAEKHFKRAIELKSSASSSYEGLGEIYAKKGDINKAIEYYYKAVELGDFYATYANLGSILIYQGKWSEAEELLNKAILKFPKDPNLKWLMAFVYRREGQIDRAKSLLEEALKDDPKNEAVKYFLNSFQNLK